jgi:hypothetical protein
MKDSQRNNVVIALLVILASFAGIYYYDGPLYKTALETRDAQQATLDAKVAQLEQVNSLKVILPDLQSASDQILKNGMPTGDSWSNIVEQGEQMMLSQSKFSVENFNIPTSKSATANANEAIFTMSVTGKLTDLDELFEIISTNVRPMFVKSFSITPTKLEGVISSVITVSTYMPTQQPATSGATSKSGGAATSGGAE